MRSLAQKQHSQDSDVDTEPFVNTHLLGPIVQGATNPHVFIIISLPNLLDYHEILMNASLKCSPSMSVTLTEAPRMANLSEKEVQIGREHERVLWGADKVLLLDLGCSCMCVFTSPCLFFKPPPLKFNVFKKSLHSTRGSIS